MLAPDIKQRQVRRLLAEGRIATYEKGELVVKLQEMEFQEDEALLAAENCEDVYSATKFLRQECELCANSMNVTEVHLSQVLLPFTHSIEIVTITLSEHACTACQSHARKI